MHSLLIAALFVAMVLSPCILAIFTLPTAEPKQFV